MRDAQSLFQARVAVSSMNSTTEIGSCHQPPRIAYIGDTPIESTFHGSALLYRLLDTVPKGRLLILETGRRASAEDQRLRGATYNHYPPRQLVPNVDRPAALLSWIRLWGAPRRRRLFRELLASFAPEAILTIAYGASWRLAAAVAAERRIALHIALHDDWGPWLRGVLPNPLRKTAVNWFRQVLRQASSRFAISPYMAQLYERDFDASCTVLYPCRSSDAPVYARPPTRVVGRMHVAYAGSVFSEAYAKSIADCARAVQGLAGRVLLFCPRDQGPTRYPVLNEPNIEFLAPLETNLLIATLRERADLLFVPMSFDARDRYNMQIAFPSKLADYTATGLPLLVYGPTYCSAVQWARDHPGVAEVVDGTDISRLKQAIAHVAGDPRYHETLGRASLACGGQMFTHSAVTRIFLNALGP